MNKNSFDLVELSHDLNQRLKNSGINLFISLFKIKVSE